MIISRTPLRVSLVGGGTDLPSFYEAFGGAVLSFSIQKYIYLSMHKYFEPHGSLLKYSATETPRSVEEIQHRIIRQVFTDLDMDRVDFNSTADVPAGTGMGSSSAFTVGLLNLCYAYKGIYVSRARLAALACEIEIDKLKDPIGKQDQYSCALGGINFIEFVRDGTVLHESVPLDLAQRRRLEESLVMFYLGGTRSAAQILMTQRANSTGSAEVIDNLRYMAGQARSLRAEIQRDVDVIGPYLNEGWARKRRLAAGITNPLVDGAYARAREAGATGGKLLGAGGSGFLLAYVPPASRQAVIDSLSEFEPHEVRVDYAGAVIAYSD